MNYLTIIMAVWAMCAVLFIRGATIREAKPVPVRSRETTFGKKDLSRTA